MSNENVKLSRSENMSRIKPKDTKPELLLRRKLWSIGFRYRKNDLSVFGKPDIVFKTKKIAVFCDSEFWHGKKYLDGEIPKTNTEFWIRKFEKNIQRDIEVNNYLKSEGWIVMRFWEKQIKKDTGKCVEEIVEVLNEK